MPIEKLTAGNATIEGLADLLIETVANGDSVSFMHPLTRGDAITFWKKSLSSADKGERVVLGYLDDQRIVSTVTLLLDFPPNQPHRCEIAKMMTSLRYRGRGLAKQLLHYAEQIAREKGKSLICLDTAEDGGAAGLYEKLDYQRVGIIPDFALKPYGGLTGTILYYKKLD